MQLRGKLFSTGSFKHADTAAALARVLAAQGGKGNDARALKLYQSSIRTVEESGGWLWVGVGCWVWVAGCVGLGGGVSCCGRGWDAQ